MESRNTFNQLQQILKKITKFSQKKFPHNLTMDTWIAVMTTPLKKIQRKNENFSF